MPKTSSVLTAAAAAVLLATGLAACSASSPSPSSSAKPAANACQNVKSGKVSDSVKVEGAFRAAPTVTIPSPLKTSDVERTVVIKGKGATVEGGSSVDIALAAYSGTTGKELTPASGFGDQPAQTVQVNDKAFVPGLVRAIECERLGTRVVLTAPAKTAFGSVDISKLNLTAKDSVVFVADVISLTPTRADGASVTPPAGFPAVKLDAKTGEPAITIPKADPPTATKVALLKQGSGDTVQSGDTVTVQYKGVLWRNGKVFDSSWSRGAPASFQTTGVVAGFQKALEGQKVGSQVIAVIPPADGYGAQGSGEIKGTDTMVFVIDILKTAR